MADTDRNVREPAINTTLPVAPLQRIREDRFVGGVAAGIAAHLRLPVVVVRLAFVALLGVKGVGLLLYAAYWVILPERGEAGTARRSPLRLVPFLAVGAALVILQLLGKIPGVNLLAGVLLAIVAGGAGIIWHQSDQAQRRRWRQTMPSAPWLGAVVQDTDRRLVVLRFIGGGVLVIGGLIGVVVVYSPVGEFDVITVLSGVLFALVGIAGVALVAAPVLWRVFAQLRAEQAGRIREQERAELAAMIHDQVLHTLALITRNAGDSKTVQRLARGQERSLRNWLYKPTGSPSEQLAAALEQVAAEVEDTYGITVETVIVGDAAVDERVAAVVAATREALVNAARHAGVPSVSLYAEVEPALLSVFVRDRGAGFDLAAVPADRHGVHGSIVARMSRHGGSAVIRSAAGEGTEVRITLPDPTGTVTPDGQGER